ncbi:hypothetical protein BOTCAL_0440g00020 [Botryotinia calthae]|uniref:Uncharacterized protein n=1 Tax=Botryotinia calthae TaxID=38488 RepID=A0A4Y8CR73_9HELO|nr:hypothetical protein BOTCAL_0440g00020 [Botryotinia calthae]
MLGYEVVKWKNSLTENGPPERLQQMEQTACPASSIGRACDSYPLKDVLGQSQGCGFDPRVGLNPLQIASFALFASVGR